MTESVPEPAPDDDADRTDERGATSLDGMNICGAGNVLALTQRFVYEGCTLPHGHPEWQVNPASGYSYNHCNVGADSWWNDPGSPLKGHPLMDQAEAMKMLLATGPGNALLGCDWGAKVALPDDMAKCPDQATKRIMLYHEDRQMLVQLCPKHASRVNEETTTHTM